MDRLSIRVTYADVDAMGIVYYANYLRYFEQGRGEFLRNRGISYREVEEQGYYLPVTEASCRYLKSARYDDLVILDTWVTGARGARVDFDYCLRNESGEVLATGSTRHAVLSADGKPTRLPPQLQRVLVPERDG